MELGTVCAVVDLLPGRHDLRVMTCSALEAQERRLDEIVLARPGARPVEALAGGADWLWWLDGATVPQTGALGALAAALHDLGEAPAPLVLASKVLDRAGALHPDALPRHEIFEKEQTVAAAGLGLVQLRAAPAGALLIHRSAFARFGSPREDLPAGWAAFELTARVLKAREDTGYLVPASVAVRQVPPRPGGRRGGGLRARARLLGGGIWNPTEWLWESWLVGEGAVRAARERAHPA